MNYLLDADTCIYAMKGNANVLRMLLSKKRLQVAISVITEAELRTGAAKSTMPRKMLALLCNFMDPLQILSFNSADALIYAAIRSELEKTGKPIGPMDTLIAAHAVSRQHILVTNNQREFSRVAGLETQNWQVDASR